MLLADEKKQVFNLDEICRGALIYAKHKTWQEGHAGIVTEASGDTLRVQYLPSVRNVLNHYFIHASEAAGGEWEIRYSADCLVTVSVFPGTGEEGGGGGPDGPE